MTFAHRSGVRSRPPAAGRLVADVPLGGRISYGINLWAASVPGIALTLNCWIPSSPFPINAGVWGNWDGFGTNGRVQLRGPGSSGLPAQNYCRITLNGTAFTSQADIAAYDTWMVWGFVYDAAFGWYAFTDSDRPPPNSGAAVPLAASTEDIRTGATPGGAAHRDFTRYIKDVAFWGTASLGAAAIDDIRSGGNPLSYSPTNFWPLDGDGTDTVGGQDAVITGGVTFVPDFP